MAVSFEGGGGGGGDGYFGNISKRGLLSSLGLIRVLF